MESKTKLKINHLRLSPEPPELAGFYVDSLCKGGKHGVGTRLLLPLRCTVSRVLAFLGWLPVRPSGCTATSTAPGAEARLHEGLACQVSAATVLGKGSHGRRFHSTIDAPRPLPVRFVTERDTGAQDRICVNFAMRKLQIRRVDFHPFVPEHGRERGHYGSFPGGFRWNQRRTPVGRV